MKEVQKIKGLKSQLSNLQGELAALKLEVSNRQKEYALKEKAVRTIEAEIKKLESDDTLKVSEHAVLRYMERVRGLAIKEIENDILSEQVRELVDKLGGNGTYPSNGFSVVMKNYTVTTIT